MFNTNFQHSTKTKEDLVKKEKNYLSKLGPSDKKRTRTINNKLNNIFLKFNLQFL